MLRTDIEDDELDQALAAHERPDREALTRVETLEPGSDGAAAKLADERNDAEENDVAPRLAVVEQAEVGLEAGDWEGVGLSTGAAADGQAEGRTGKVDWQEEDGDEVLDLNDHVERDLARDGKRGNKAAENCVDANDVGHEGRGKDEEEGRRPGRRQRQEEKSVACAR